MSNIASVDVPCHVLFKDKKAVDLWVVRVRYEDNSLKEYEFETEILAHAARKKFLTPLYKEQEQFEKELNHYWKQEFAKTHKMIENSKSNLKEDSPTITTGKEDNMKEKISPKTLSDEVLRKYYSHYKWAYNMKPTDKNKANLDEYEAEIKLRKSKLVNKNLPPKTEEVKKQITDTNPPIVSPTKVKNKDKKLISPLLPKTILGITQLPTTLEIIEKLNEVIEVVNNQNRKD